MIHKTRKREGKDNSIIYGVATDNFDYRFWRIDNNSDVSIITICKYRETVETSSTNTYEWSKKSQRKYIYSIFRSIIRAAILTTPTTSPVKGKELGGNFQRANNPKLDFGSLSLWQDLFTPEGYSETSKSEELAGRRRRIESVDDENLVGDERRNDTGIQQANTELLCM